MVMPSLERKIPISFASTADLATCAVPIISKALATAGMGPLGNFGSFFRRNSISLQPPQPGITPTPTSTKPA